MKKLQIKQIKNIVNAIKRVVGKNEIGLHDPNLGLLEKKEINRCIDSGFVSTSGNYYIKKFETKIKKIVKSKYVIAVNNGTSAIQLGLKVLDIKKNDEVLLPSFNFIAAANAILYCDAIPHFVDIDERNLFIDPYKLDEYLKNNCIKKKKYTINKKTKNVIKAIIPLHPFGHSGEIKTLKKIAYNYKIKILEDAAEALGSYYDNQHLGTFGQIGIISFNGNKIVTTGGGGAVITNSLSIAKKVRKLSQISKIYHPWNFVYDGIGYNFRMPNVNAALGCAQLKRLKKNLKRKRIIFKKYKSVFAKFNKLRLLEETSNCKSNYWLQNIVLEGYGKNVKEKILENAHKNGLYLRPAWCLLHKLKHLKKFPKSDLSKSIKMFNKIISLPSNF